MYPLWLLLAVFVACAEAGGRLEVRVQLGHSATLTCPVNTSHISWYIQIHSQVKGLLARTFGVGPNYTAYFVYDTTKYLAVGNTLVIKNTTAEDCRLYYCARKQGGKITVSNTVHLLSDVPVTECTNDSTVSGVLHSKLALYVSVVLNIVLVTTGLVCTAVCLKRRKCRHLVDESSPSTCENPKILETPQYEEIQLRTPPPAVPPAECIYYKAQLPQPH